MHKYADIDRTGRFIKLLLFALQFVVASSVYASRSIALNVTATVIVADSPTSEESSSGGGSGGGIDPDTSGDAIAGQEIVVNRPETIHSSQYVRFTVVIPEPQLATKVTLRAFGNTYVLTKKTRSAYVASLVAPNTVGTYPYTVTAYYGGSTSASTRGVFEVTTKHGAVVEKPVPLTLRPTLTLEEPVIITPVDEEILPTSTPSPVSTFSPVPTVIPMNGEYDPKYDPRIPDNLKDHTYETVVVRLIDDQGKGLVGARVTIASKPQTDVSDDDGNVSFKNIPVGEHTITVAYNSAIAQQSLFLDQPTRSVQVLIATQLEGGYSLWQLAVFGVVCIIGTLGLIVLVGKYKRRYNR